MIINLWKENVIEFWLSRHNFLLLFCFLYGLLPTHQLVSIITFSIYFGRTCTYFIIKSVLFRLVGHNKCKIWFSVICIIIYIFTKYFDILKLWYQNLKLDKTYLPKGSWKLFNLNNPWNSKHRSRTLSVKIHNYISRGFCCEYFESGNWDG